MFADDLQVIDRLRQDAVNVQEPHISGVKRLQAYAAQLGWLGGKFPIDIGVDFPWYPAIGLNTATPILQNNIRFELANVLFNLASLYTQLAFSSNRTTSDGLKTAAGYFSSGAGTLHFLRTDILSDMRSTPPEDMDESTLDCLESLFLVQAQECFWQKAVKDGMKDGTIARLAAKVSDYYADAYELAIKSNTITTEWIHHFAAKQHHFAAAAQYRQSQDCLEKRKYGEEVARLKDSITCVNEALKESKWISRTVLGDLNGLKNKVVETLKRAEKDNDMIYLTPVPPKSELRTIDRANMVAPKPPMEVADGVDLLAKGQILGKPLFVKLVPYAVHKAAEMYADRRDRLVQQSIIAEMEAMTQKVRELLQSLNLPGSLQALEKPLGLPPSLTSKAEELKQQDAVYRLKRSMEDTDKLKANDQAIFNEGVGLLKQEKDEDEQARAKYGTDRWQREPSELAAQKLYSQSSELSGYLASAGNSDNLVRKKIKENEQILGVLTGSSRDLTHYVPSSSRAMITPALEREVARLRGCLNDVNRLETSRRRKIETLREKAKSDDINPALLAETSRLEREFPMTQISPAQFEPLFDERLDTYEVDRERLSVESSEQEALIVRINQANKAFLLARRGDSSTKEREKALQDLENGYTKYKEIISNLDTGRKFYNDLAGHVNRFRDAARAFASQRRMEAAQLEGEIIGTQMADMSLQETSKNLQRQRTQENYAPQRPVQVAAGQKEPLPAPQPTRAQKPPGAVNGVWNPEMGIRFG